MPEDQPCDLEWVLWGNVVSVDLETEFNQVGSQSINSAVLMKSQ